MNYRKIILVDDLDFLKQNYKGIIDVYNRENAKILPLSDIVYLYLKEQGIDCIDYHQFERPDLYKDNYSTARQWGTKWYRPKDKDYSVAESLSLGSTVEWYMIYFFSNFLRRYLLINEIVATAHTEEILFVTSESVDILKAPLKLRNVNLDELSVILSDLVKRADPNIKLKFIYFPYFVRKEGRKFRYVRPLFSILNVFASGAIRLKNLLLGNRKLILFYEGYRHFQPIIALGCPNGFAPVHLEKEIGPRNLFKLYSRGAWVDVLGNRRAAFAADKPYFNEEGLRQELSDFFTYNGNNLLHLVWPRIKFLLNVFFPGFVYPDLLKAISSISRIRPACIVTENDSTYSEKMVVLIAKMFGIPSVVVQNGATCTGKLYENKEAPIHDFYPLVADKLFVFGQANKDWCEGMGMDTEKIVITGAARFDSYYLKRKIVSPIKERRQVLVILSDVTDQDVVVSQEDLKPFIFYEHIKYFIDLARKNPQIDFVIRPHHDIQLWNHIFNPQLKEVSNVTINREHHLFRVFLDSDVVIGYYSTALIEALIFKKIVISLDTGGYANLLPLWDYGLSKRVTSLRELDCVLPSVFASGEEWRMILDNIDKNLRFLNYNNDGLASQRIAQELCNISKAN